ncbi:MAG: transcription-repair coupling factor [bacterium]
MLFDKKFLIEINNLIEKYQNGEINYTHSSELALQAAALKAKFPKRNIVLVVDDEKEIEKNLEDLEILTQTEVYSFKSWDKAKIGEFSPSNDISVDRIKFLYKLINDTGNLFILEQKFLHHLIPNEQRLKKFVVTLNPGQSSPYYKLVEQLILGGYELCTNVLNAGEYSRRGGIIDVFPVNLKHPVRIEFSGEVVEEIRFFDPGLQTSFKTADEVEILPAKEYFLTRNEIDRYLHDHPEYPDVFIEGGELLAQKIRNDDIKIDKILEQSMVLSAAEVKKSYKWIPCHWSTGIFSPLEQFTLELHQDRNDFLTHLSKEYGDWKKIILIRSKSMIKKLKKIFPRAQYYPFSLSCGFKIPDLHYLILTEKELFQVEFKRSPKKFSKNTLKRDEIMYLPYGSLVVHEQAGIGRYHGVKVIDYHRQKTECLVLEYANRAWLYLPVNKLYLLSRYIGPENKKNPPLSVLGTAQWEKRKLKAKKIIWDLTMELAELYGKRTQSKTKKLTSQHELVEEVVNNFDYEETDDQNVAIQEIYRDLEMDKPMDRLLCGEVGYGKTEVALRAAVKVVESNHQVAILAPTTILAQQHFDVFRERLKNLPVTVEMISRFVEKSKVDSVLEDAGKGVVDILIGTHRLLSTDVKFKNIGLLVIDEEHKFGVKQKEKIKKLKTNVNVLSMSATPIPRTLHMSMWNLMDISMIQTPPPGRYPVETHILPFSEQIIVDAVNFEIQRGGQVFFLHNRIESLSSIYQYLSRILPNISIAYAHGKMRSAEIEKVMFDFYHHHYDLLLSTSIIESGIDIPNANTLIVDRADSFGLAQLHQIRGRIGRGLQRAYCYFLIPLKGPRTHQGKERLRAIRSYSKLGAGYQLAVHDMRIRGVGNLLGSQQSGFDCDIGYELYLKYLNEAIHKLRAGSGEQGIKEIELSVDLPYYLPPDYIEDSQERVYLYRRISTADIDNLKNIKNELIDRFGDIPPQAENFFKVSRIYRIMKDLDWMKVVIGEDLKIEFAEDTKRCYIEKFVKSLPEKWNPFFIRQHQQLVVQIKNWSMDFKKLENFIERFKKILNLTEEK